MYIQVYTWHICKIFTVHTLFFMGSKRDRYSLSFIWKSPWSHVHTYVSHVNHVWDGARELQSTPCMSSFVYARIYNLLRWYCSQYFYIWVIYIYTQMYICIYIYKLALTYIIFLWSILLFCRRVNRRAWQGQVLVHCT